MGARVRRLRGLTKNFLRRAQEASRGKTLNDAMRLEVHAIEDANFLYHVNELLRNEEERHG
jgi:hypothetical protein